MSPTQIEPALRDLAGRLDYPPERDLVPSVAARLRPRRNLWRRSPVLLAAVLVLGGTAAVATGLIIRGVEIRRTPTPTVAPAPRTIEDLALGEPIALQKARRAVDFGVAVPSVLGPPDLVFLGTEPAGGRVTLLYRPRADLPRDATTDIGALLTVFRGRPDHDLLRKEVGPDTHLRFVRVGQAQGIWITGAPHTLVFLDDEGEPFPDSARLAGNVLLWEVGDLTYRLEADVDLDRALAIARSI